MHRTIKAWLFICLSLTACTVGIVEQKVLTPSASVSSTPEPIASSVPTDPTIYPSPTITPHVESPTATPTLAATPRVESPTATPALPPEPTDVILADCFRSFHVAAWQDLDGDGLWGVSEPPLEGVEFQLTGVGGVSIVSGYPYLSDADGRLTIVTWHPGECVQTGDEETITAVPPESYEPTTHVSVTFPLTSTDFSFEAQFGFRPVSE